MHVLHIGDELLWRGGENQIRLLVEGLMSRGIQTTIAYPKRSRAYARFQTIANTCALPTRSPLDPRNVWILEKFCQDKGVNILDAQSSGGLSLALAVKNKLPHLKLVVHRRVHNKIKNSFFSKKKYLNPNIDKYVCISHAIAKVLEDYGIDKKKIAVVPSAVSEEPYTNLDRLQIQHQMKNKYNLIGETVLLGNASAMTSEKGYDVFLRACKEIVIDKPYHIFLAGDGPLKSELESYVRKNQLDKTVHFLGHINNVHEFLSGLDILIVPSLSEGLGTILLEGAYAGSALIGSRVGGIPEIIKNGETGLLAEPGSSNELAECMIKLIGDSALREKLAENAKAHVRKNFSLQVMIEGNIQVYNNVV